MITSSNILVAVVVVVVYDGRFLGSDARGICIIYILLILYVYGGRFLGEDAR